MSLLTMWSTWINSDSRRDFYPFLSHSPHPPKQTSLDS